MDIYSFVNSKDIREHLRKMDYRFDSLETAWLIYQCRHISYEEQKVAWTELIHTMPDCEVPKRSNCRGWNSIHAMLQEYMDTYDKIIAEFYNDDPEEKYVYMYSYLYKRDKRWTEEFDTIYGSLEECLKAYKEDVDDLDETYSPDETGVLCYQLCKKSLRNPKLEFVLEYDGKGKLVEVVTYYPKKEEYEDILDYSFGGLWFNFPTPFQKGDIVWQPKHEDNIVWLCDGGFVLLGLETWEPWERVVEEGDNSDMVGFGYFVADNGEVYYEVMHNYMDLEYYNGPYKDNERILPAVSRCVKGEIGLDFLLSIHRRLLLDRQIAELHLGNWVSNGLLEEMGLAEK